MTVLTLISLLLALGYGLLPYALAVYMIPDRFPLSRTEKSIRAAALGLVLFCLLSHAWISVSLAIFIIAHAVLTGLVILVLFAAQRKHEKALTEWKFAAPVILLLTAAFSVRILPPLLSADWLGCIDARFHNILAQSILKLGHLPGTWQPFADIPVSYPLGTHAMMAFLSVNSGAPVHHAFSLLLAFTGALTAGVLFVTAMRLFRNRESAMLAAAAYGFLPIMGSLAYLSWGGLPNAAGMLFLCLLVLLMLEAHSAESFQPVVWLYMLICLAGMRCTHHYSYLVALLLLFAQFAFGPTPKLRRISARLILVALLLGVVSSVPEIMHLRTGLANSGTLKFPEPPITLFRIILDMNPAFVALACFAYYIAVRQSSAGTAPDSTVPCVFVLAWAASLLGAFVFLEYIYRAAVLIITGGRECYVALTPSRMATNLVYPLSLLCGTVPLWTKWRRYRRPILTLFSTAAAATIIYTLHYQHSRGEHPGSRSMADWISENTDSRSMLVSALPHLEYLTWRETSYPPIPASEERNSPSVTWKFGMKYHEQWIEWEKYTGRSVYYLTPDPGHLYPPILEKIYATHNIAVMKHAIPSSREQLKP
jgi:hypothetical protein